jgi:hypothetical protein
VSVDKLFDIFSEGVGMYLPRKAALEEAVFLGQSLVLGNDYIYQGANKLLKRLIICFVVILFLLLMPAFEEIRKHHEVELVVRVLIDLSADTFKKHLLILQNLNLLRIR